MHFKFLIPFLAFHISIHSAEIILQNGDAFICDIVSEDSDTVKISYRDKKFEIPRQEIQSVNPEKKGSHISYATISLILHDGSSIKGILVDEDKKKYVLQTKIGYLDVDKNTVREMKGNSRKEPPDLPSGYQAENYKFRKHAAGISGFAGAVNPHLSGIGSVSGGSVFIEPSYWQFYEKYRIGLRSDYSSGTGNAVYTNGSLSFYIQRNWTFSRWLDFYAGLGAGGAYLHYRKAEIQTQGLDPIGTAFLGYQGIKFGSFQIRFGGRVTAMYEKGGSTSYPAGELMAVYEF